MNRRQFTQLTIAAASLAPFMSFAQAIENYEQRKQYANDISIKAHKAFMATKDIKMMGSEKIAMLLYPGFYAADLVNPQFIFNTNSIRHAYCLIEIIWLFFPYLSQNNPRHGI